MGFAGLRDVDISAANPRARWVAPARAVDRALFLGSRPVGILPEDKCTVRGRRSYRYESIAHDLVFRSKQRIPNRLI